MVWLPITIKEILEQNSDIPDIAHILTELQQNRSFFQGIYKLAFSDYQGFDSLQFKGQHILGDDF